MRSTPERVGKAAALAMVGILAALVVRAIWVPPLRPRAASVTGIGVPGGTPTTRAGLEQASRALRVRVEEDPADVSAAVVLAEALMRRARTESDATLVVAAEKVLARAIAYNPNHYEGRRELAVVYLAQHRFRDAIAAAREAERIQPNDSLIHGIIGDAYLELGEYDRAFDAFDAMMRKRPSSAAYARVAYARELQGDLIGALKNMQMAADATIATDQEAQAWHSSQIGNLHLQMGRLTEAEREFRRADFTFPAHPYALTGLARVAVARGDLRGALHLYDAMLRRTPTPELAASAGDLHMRLGERDEAERLFAEAERLEREGWKVEEPQPAALARFLAERDRGVPEAIALAERAAASRQDINTLDALAWSYYKGGRLEEADTIMQRVVRTGTRDRRILYHAAAIRHSRGDCSGAARLLQRALDGNPRFDIVAAPAAAALARRLPCAANPPNQGAGL